MDGGMRYAHTTKCSTKLRILFEICEKKLRYSRWMCHFDALLLKG